MNMLTGIPPPECTKKKILTSYQISEPPPLPPIPHTLHQGIIIIHPLPLGRRVRSTLSQRNPRQPNACVLRSSVTRKPPHGPRVERVRPHWRSPRPSPLGDVGSHRLWGWVVAHDKVFEEHVVETGVLQRDRVGAEVFEHVEDGREPEVLDATIAFGVQRETEVLKRRG